MSIYLSKNMRKSLVYSAVTAAFAGSMSLSAMAEEAVDNARKGKGPTLIECYTYRMCNHSTLIRRW